MQHTLLEKRHATFAIEVLRNLSQYRQRATEDKRIG